MTDLYVVYNNVISMLKNREYDELIIEGKNTKLIDISLEDFEKLQQPYVIIAKKKDKQLIIVIEHTGENKSNVLEKMIKISMENINKYGKSDIIIIISGKKTDKTKSLLMTKYEEYSLIFMFYYEFEINPFDNYLTPRQELLKDKSLLPFKDTEIPLILVSDRIVRWLGGTDGQILVVYRPDYATKSIVKMYRRIIKVIKNDQKSSN